MPPNDESLQPGQLFGRYQIVRQLGAGGMGAVFEAVHTGLRKHVAIKVLRREVMERPDVVERFVREGEAASRVRHPHVLEVFDVGVLDGVAYLVMEYLDGEDLATTIQRAGPLAVEHLAEVMLPVCSAVAAAHASGVIHRDLKPANIFLCRTAPGAAPHPKVLDFGVSKLLDAGAGAALTGTQAMLGTPYYMSPEHLNSSRNVDARSDQYALGVILYEAATGRQPFQAASLTQAIAKILAAQVDPLRQLRPDVPEAFARVVHRAMSPAAGARFGSVQELGRELLAFASVRRRDLYAEMFGATPEAFARTDQLQAAPTAPPSAVTRPPGGWQAPSPPHTPAPAAHSFGAGAPTPATRAASVAMSQGYVDPPPTLRSEPMATAAPAPAAPAHTGTWVAFVLLGAFALGAGALGVLHVLRRDDPPPRAAPAGLLVTPGLSRLAAPLLPQSAAPPPQPSPRAPSEACEAGDPGACLALGESAFFGREGPVDYARAATYLTRACDGGQLRACARLARLYREGQGGLARDEGRAAVLYTRACDGGEMAGCAGLGTMYRTGGGGILRDPARAAELFRRGCDAGHQSSCTDLGSLYDAGAGVPRDYLRALTLFQRACDADDPYACANLGAMYALGHGVQANNPRAAELFRRACDGRAPTGCSNLGELYARGLGVPRDRAQARALWQRACDAGDARSCARAR